jgi:hypothetical protein
MTPRQWTILDEGGGTAVNFTSFIEIDYGNGGKALEYPIEEGSFADYNKVQDSKEIRVTLATQGTDAEFNDILAKLEDYQSKAVKLSIATPSDFYEGYTLENLSYVRAVDRNANMLTVELVFKEVREVKTQVTTGAITKPKNPTSSKKVDTGKTQTQGPEEVGGGEKRKSIAKQIGGLF